MQHKCIKASFFEVYPITKPVLIVIGLYTAHKLDCQFQGVWPNSKMMEFQCNKTGGNFSCYSAKEAQRKVLKVRERFNK
jgi:hypothetical protein